MLPISLSRVAHVIVRAREIDAKVGRWDGPGDTADADTILEARRGDATEAELRAFIAGLNEDEQTALVAIAWIGRDTYGPEDWDEAVATARHEATTATEDYLLGMPLLPDYLEEGLEKLGYSAGDAEDEIL